MLPTYVWSNLAGLIDTAGSADGQTAQVGLLYIPEDVATDSNGNVFVADTYNYTIRKITPAGVMTTFAGAAGNAGSADGTGSAARFYFPEALAIDGSNNIYVADTDNSTIRKITPAGVVTTFAGQAGNRGSADGTGSVAQFYFPSAITVDSSSGNIYVVDNERIRAITPTGVVTTLAGTFQIVGHADGIGAAATFSNPSGIVADGHGNLYVSDTYNFTIRKVTTAGVVTTFAGTAGTNGFTDGTGAAAKFYYAQGITIDGSGNLYVGDTDNEAIRKITTPGAVVTTFAGGVFGSNNGTGTAAQFASPEGLGIDGNGNIYVADSDNEEIRKITPTAAVTTIAGVVEVTGSTDGGPATNVPEFNTPEGVAFDANDNVYVADTANNTIREITPTGTVTTIAGKAGTTGTTNGTGSAIRFNTPTSLDFDSNGNLFVADSGNDTIRKLTHSGSTWTSTTFAGTAGTAGAVNATGTAASFSTPTGIAIDTSNNIYVADSVNDLIREITPGGVVTTFAGVAGSAGTTNGAAASAKFSAPSGVAVDASGNVYVADTTNNLIREISAGTVSTIAGAASGFVDGIGTAGHFQGPFAIAVDGSGNLYVADTNDSAIREIIPFGANWMVTTIGGNGFGTSPNGGSAQLTGSPQGVAVDAQGNVVVADTFNDRIAIGAAILPPSINPPLTANGTQNSAFTYGISATNMPSPFSSYSATGLPANLSVNTITGAITGTPTGFGSFSPSISATNLAGSASATLALSIASSQTPYQAWKSTQFSAGQLANPAISGDNATPANDGIPNLLKYSLGLLALQSYNPGAAGLPSVQIQNVSGTNYLTLTFHGTATDVTYIVQATGNLSGVWTTIQTFQSGGSAPGTVTVQDTQPISAASSRYMRLRVTTP